MSLHPLHLFYKSLCFTEYNNYLFTLCMKLTNALTSSVLSEPFLFICFVLELFDTGTGTARDESEASRLIGLLSYSRTRSSSMSGCLRFFEVGDEPVIFLKSGQEFNREGRPFVFESVNRFATSPAAASTVGPSSISDFNSFISVTLSSSDFPL